MTSPNTKIARRRFLFTVEYPPIGRSERRPHHKLNDPQSPLISRELLGNISIWLRSCQVFAISQHFARAGGQVRLEAPSKGALWRSECDTGVGPSASIAFSQ